MPEPRIRFHYLARGFTLKNRTSLKKFLLFLCRKEGRKVAAVNYIFCSDAYLARINREYLKHDTYTDIITFELSPKGSPLLSDIYISIDRVQANAKTFQSTFTNELHRVIFHGALHLCGYGDKSARESKLMRYKEEFYLGLYFVPRETKKVF